MAAAATTTEELLGAHTHIVHHALAHFGSVSLKCAIQLDIPDIINAHGRPLPLSVLASSLAIPDARKPHLQRLMRLLASMGYFTVHLDQDHEAYALTPNSKVLLKDSPSSLSSWVLAMMDENFMSFYHVLPNWIKQERLGTPFELKRGLSLWDARTEDRGFNELYDEAWAADTRVVAQVLVSECRWAFDGLGSLVDVGGGTGTLARAVAAAFPAVRVTVFDLPHVIESLPESDVVQGVGGDMFRHIPSANAVLLKMVMYVFSDEQCVKILKLCKEAIPSREDGGKVMIVDLVLQNGDQALTHSYWDTLLLSCTDGKVRKEEEWNDIFVAAGFTDYTITPLGFRSLIQVFP